MQNGNIRVGRISSVNVAKGTASVVYKDRENQTTTEFPLFAFGGEFSVYKKGDLVLVLHMSNNLSYGIVMGKFWNEVNAPPSGTTFYKNMGGASISVSGGQLIFSDAGGSISLKQIISKCNS